MKVAVALRRDVDCPPSRLATVFAVSKGDLSRPNPSGVLQRALITVLLGALATLAALSTGLAAEAQEGTNSLQSIDPPNGATLDQSPTAIVLSFNQELRSDDRPIVVLSCGSPSQPQDTGSPEVDDDGLIVTIPINTPVPTVGVITMSTHAPVQYPWALKLPTFPSEASLIGPYSNCTDHTVDQTIALNRLIQYSLERPNSCRFALSLLFTKIRPVRLPCSGWAT